MLRVAIGGGDESAPYCIEQDGTTWTQQAGETLDSLMNRAQASIPVNSVPTGIYPVLMLVARRRPDPDAEGLRTWPAAGP